MTNDNEVKVSEKILYNRHYVVIAVILAALVVLLALIVSLAFQFRIIENLVLGWILTTLYSIAAFFLFDTRTVREIERRIIEQVPVVERIEVPVNVPVNVPVIKEIEKPVIRTVEVDRPVYRYKYFKGPVVEKIKRIYIEKPRKKLNIPKFDFIGSTEEKRFHTRNCRLGKLIKKNHKVHSNSQSFFKKKHFKACKVCILKKKRI